MDEKGFMKGQYAQVKVFCSKQGRHTRKTEYQNQVMVTMLQSVSATAGFLLSMVLYKGQEHPEELYLFVKHNGSHIAISDKV